jgi:hypothetical protein
MIVTPRQGPCAPWITAGDVQGQTGCGAYSSDVLIDAASVASDILYRLSGKLYTGVCGPVTVRPQCRPTDAASDRGWSQLGILSWGSCGGMTSQSNVAAHYGHTEPREVDLGAFPVTEIIEVLIDGVTIPADEYLLQDYRRLVRMLPTVDAVPTERYGWPTAQRLDLPDTELGTFSVTYNYGTPPPVSGVRAAKSLAENLAKAFSGDKNQLPVRTTSISRQGISAAATDVEDILKLGMTGIYTVDLFLSEVNPGGQRNPSTVYSPDVGRPRRMPRSS